MQTLAFYLIITKEFQLKKIMISVFCAAQKQVRVLLCWSPYCVVSTDTQKQPTQTDTQCEWRTKHTAWGFRGSESLFLKPKTMEEASVHVTAV